MKFLIKILFIIFLVTLSTSCGGDDSGGGGGGGETGNTAPTIPDLIYPTNNKFCIDNLLTFKWGASSDPDKDVITYTIEISTNENFSSKFKESQANQNQIEIKVDKGVQYYWRIKAIDSSGNISDVSATFMFITEGDGESNQLPYAPKLVSPSLNATTQGTSVKLSWEGNDADNDPLKYDVLFGTDKNSLETLETDLSASNYTISNLQAATTYFWRIIVKDESSQVNGQVWKFNTP